MMDDSIGAELATILRDPSTAARRCLGEDRLRSLTLAALVALTLGAVVFGAVVGSYRGGAQIFFAGLKFPLSMLAALVLAAPAFHAIAAALGRPVSLRAMIALALVAAGRAGLALLAFAPLLWLAMDLGTGYHGAALAAVLAYALAGVAALGVLLRGLRVGRHRITTGLAFVVVFLAASGQTSWILRPYLVRPQTVDVPFLRPVEGGFVEASAISLRSSLGIYRRVRSEDDWFDEARGGRRADVWPEEVEATRPDPANERLPAPEARRLDGANHDSAHHDTANRDSANHDSANRDSANRDTANHDTANHDTANRDSANHDTANRDSAHHDSAHHDSAHHDTANRDRANHDSANRDRANHDRANHDSANRDSANDDGASTSQLWSGGER